MLWCLLLDDCVTAAIGMHNVSLVPVGGTVATQQEGFRFDSCGFKDVCSGLANVK